ncbi:hypothetical protein [Corallibacter sp.]|uniref:hypothetical protein n=1 Tax=Corallibacter sp. TaxID=2038084 RepID=UPI003AB25ED6
MKKIVFIFLLVPFFSFSQVNNLSDLLVVSKASVYDLIEYLQYNWELKRPVQEINSSFLSEEHEYVLNDEKRTQILKRFIRTDRENDIQVSSTIFISNEKTLLDRITNSLPYKEFQLESDNNEGEKKYNDGNYTLVIQSKSNIEMGIELDEGFYRIVIYRNLN